MPAGPVGLILSGQRADAAADRDDEARTQMREWIDAGSLVPRHVTYDGLESADGAFVDRLGGRTVGTTSTASATERSRSAAGVGAVVGDR